MDVRRLLTVPLVLTLLAGGCGGGAGHESVVTTVTTVSSAVQGSETTSSTGAQPPTTTTTVPTTPETVAAETTVPSTTFPPVPSTVPMVRTLPAQTDIWGWVETSYQGLLRIRRADGVAWEVVDPWYPSWFSVVAGDLSGGLVFQYSPTPGDGPPTVAPGTILQLAAGADRPVSLIEPRRGELYVLFEVSEIEGAPTLIFASLTGWHASTRSFGPGAGPRSLWTLRIGETEPELVGTWGDQPGEPELLSASYADGRFLVAVRERGSRCVWFEFVDHGPHTNENVLNPLPGPRTCEDGLTVFLDAFSPWGGTRERPMLSNDGTIVVYQQWTLEYDTANPDMGDVVVFSLIEGWSEVVDALGFLDYDRGTNLLIQTEGLQNPARVALIDEGVDITPWDARGHVWLTSPVRIAPAATLDAGVAFVPCSSQGTFDTVLEQPELPAAVAETRRALIAAAGACDFTSLTSMAAGNPRFEYSNLWVLDSDTCPATCSARQPWVTREEFAPALVKGDVYHHVLDLAVRALNRPHRVEDRDGSTVYVWTTEPVSWQETSITLEVVIGESGDWLRFAAEGCISPWPPR